tara:strand:- start:1365 stop:1619 length:255 start_codon:yes stop_codon:yes gene_type:complete
MTKISYNSYIIEKEETIMIIDDRDDNEVLIEAMLAYPDEQENNPFNLGYLKSFLAGAMAEMPELKRRVEKRIAHHEFLASDANK